MKWQMKVIQRKYVDNVWDKSCPTSLADPDFMFWQVYILQESVQNYHFLAQKKKSNAVTLNLADHVNSRS